MAGLTFDDLIPKKAAAPAGAVPISFDDLIPQKPAAPRADVGPEDTVQPEAQPIIKTGSSLNDYLPAPGPDQRGRSNPSPSVLRTVIGSSIDTAAKNPGAVARAVAQGASLNTADELMAGINKLKNGSTYEEEFAKQQEQIAKDKAALGRGYTAAEFAGGFATPGLGIKNIGQVYKNASAYKRAIAYAEHGAAMGTAQALGSQNTADKDFGQAIGTGGLVGGIVGGALPAGGALWRELAPVAKDLKTRGNELAQGALNRVINPNGLAPISQKTQDAVIREMATKLEDVGLGTASEYNRAKIAAQMPNTPDSLAIFGGERIRGDLLDSASLLKRQPTLNNARNPDNYVQQFAAGQMMPGGVSQQKRLQNDMFSMAAVPAGERNTRAVEEKLTKKIETEAAPLDALRAQNARVNLPGFSNLMKKDIGRSLLKDALKVTELDDSVTKAMLANINDRNVPVALAMEIRDKAKQLAAKEGTPDGNKFLEQYENILNNNFSGKKAKDISSTYENIRTAREAHAGFSEGQKTFEGDTTAKAMRSAGLYNLPGHQFQTNRLGALHAASNMLDTHGADVGKVREALTSTPESQKLWNRVVTPPNASAYPGMSAKNLDKRLAGIETRQNFVADLRDRLNSAGLNHDTFLPELADTVRRAQFSPGYAAANLADKTSKWQPQLRHEAKLRMGLDMNIPLQRREFRDLYSKTTTTPEALLARERARREVMRDTPKNAKTIALIQALLNEQIRQNSGE
jgi:hypothetical protein